MCYTGLCPYEISSGPDAGDCTLRHDLPLADYPDDAGCVVAEREQAAIGALKEERRMKKVVAGVLAVGLLIAILVIIALPYLQCYSYRYGLGWGCWQ